MTTGVSKAWYNGKRTPRSPEAPALTQSGCDWVCAPAPAQGTALAMEASGRLRPAPQTRPLFTPQRAPGVRLPGHVPPHFRRRARSRRGARVPAWLRRGRSCAGKGARPPPTLTGLQRSDLRPPASARARPAPAPDGLQTPSLGLTSLLLCSVRPPARDSNEFQLSTTRPGTPAPLRPPAPVPVRARPGGFVNPAKPSGQGHARVNVTSPRLLGPPSSLGRRCSPARDEATELRLA